MNSIISILVSLFFLVPLVVVLFVFIFAYIEWKMVPTFSRMAALYDFSSSSERYQNTLNSNLARKVEVLGEISLKLTIQAETHGRVL